MARWSREFTILNFFLGSIALAIIVIAVSMRLAKRVHWKRVMKQRLPSTVGKGAQVIISDELMQAPRTQVERLERERRVSCVGADRSDVGSAIGLVGSLTESIPALGTGANSTLRN
eukprot:TRINITY_DN6822_c0_g2_i1.p1 TRINITY_DN6822_c0_g2~~TRINITY_DN6822_c0_g2_i1.p1  ORF type:complete len:116 (+),score=4.38 TRINITY_DN6822_c0_g2_i1:67-414(+)